MRKNSYKNFRLALLDPDFRSKIEVIYTTSAVLFYIFHTIAFLIKQHVESPAKCDDTSRT